MDVSYNHNLGDVWDRSGGLYNGGIARAVQLLAWLSPIQRCRVERLRQASLLFKGRHRELFVDEHRSQFAFPSLAAGAPPFFSPFNVLGLMSRKIADLLFGESPRITIDDEATQAQIDAIVERSWLTPSLHAAAIEQSAMGEAYLEITTSDAPTQAFIGQIPTSEVFPVGRPGADRQYQSYVRYATQWIGGEAGTKPTQLLLETTYSAGKIERKLWALAVVSAAGPTRAQTLTLDVWPVKQPDGTPLLDLVETGLSRSSIVCVPNDADSASDYDGLIELQDAVNAKQTQIARVLSKHADPRLIMPPSAQDPTTGDVPAAAEVFFASTPDEKPSYLTWQAELASAIEDRKFALSALAMSAEVPLSLLGAKDDATAESASKMRLNAASAIAKAARKAGFWQPAIRLAISLAVEAESGTLPAKPIGVALRDGLPVDLVEQANAISLLRGASVMSVKRALEAQNVEGGALDDELAELQKEHEASMPSTLLGEPPVAGNSATKDDGGDDVSPTAQAA